MSHDSLKFRSIIASLSAVSGIVVYVAAGPVSPLSTADYILLACIAGFGPASIGFFLSRSFGHGEFAGWFRALATAYLCSVIGGAIAGSIILPGIGTVGGAVYGAAIITSWQKAVTWMLCATIAQLIAIRVRSWTGN